MFQSNHLGFPDRQIARVKGFNRSSDKDGGSNDGVYHKAFLFNLWRVLICCSLALSGGAIPAMGGTYTTTFSPTENPIYEGGQWINGKSAGLDWSDCATANHLAYGAQTTENPNGNPYNDSTAVLTGSWGPNQGVSGTVYFNRSGSLNNSYDEMELRLNTSISAHSCTGYEIDYSANIPPLRTGYIYIVRWNGPFADFTIIGPGTNGPALNLHTGDVISATNSNGTIRAYINGTNFLTATDNNPFTNGSPGIGFDMAGDHSQSVNYGFTSFTATDGGTSDTQAPTVPSNLTVTSTSANQVNLAWTASTDNVGVAGYQIFRNGARVATSSGAFYADTGLSPSTTYTYTVCAFDAAGNVSAQSSPASATTSVSTVAPTISSFNASPTTIPTGSSSTLSWSVSGSPTPSISIAPGVGIVTGSSVVVSPSTTTTYTITASNSAGTTSSQAVVTVTAGTDTTPPSIPTNLSVSPASSAQINLTWTASTDNVGVAGYRIFRNGIQIATSSSASYSDTGLSPSTSYTYTVSAFDAAGNVSGQSSPVNATTLAPGTPPSLVQTAGNTASGSGTTIAAAFSSANTSGNLIIVVTSWANSTASPSISDTEGNTYALATSTYSSSGDQSQAIYYAKNIKAGPNTVTVNFGGSHTWRRILMTEYQGIDAVNPVDVVVANQGSASTATDNVTSGAITTTSSGDLIFGAVANYNAHGSVSAGTGFSVQSFLIYNGFIETAVEDRLQSSPGSIAATFTLAVADSYIAQMVAFRAASQASSGSPAISSFSASPATISGGSSSTLSWSASGSPTISISPGVGTVTGSSVVVSPSTTTSYTLTAANSVGSTSAQAVVTVTAAADTTPPSVPTNLSASALSASQINLTWTASTDNVGVAGYRIFRNGVQIATSSGAAYSDTGLSLSTTYTYVVSAYDAAGNVSGQSASASATTQAAASPPSLVQTAGNTDSSSAKTITAAFSSPNTSGNLIVVVTSWAKSAANPTVSDTAGNTYVLAVSTYSSSSGQSQAIYFAKNIKAGPNTVTVNFGGVHTWRRILMAEYRGIDPINPVDGTVANQGSATTARDNVTSGAITTTSNGDLIFGAAANYNARSSLSAGTGFSMRSFLICNSVIETAVEDMAQSSAGSAAATFTLGVADSYIAQMVAFRAAGQ